MEPQVPSPTRPPIAYNLESRLKARQASAVLIVEVFLASTFVLFLPILSDSFAVKNELGISWMAKI